MPTPSPLNPLAAAFLQSLVRQGVGSIPVGPNPGVVGGGFRMRPNPGGFFSGPGEPFTMQTFPGPSTLNDMVSGMFALPGNRGIQTQLLRMLGNTLQPNSPLSAIGGLDAQFPETIVPMFRQSR